MFGSWNPIKDITKAVENVTKEVSKGVNNVVSETGKAVQLTGQVVGNVGTLVGGDVGKVINAVTSPLGAQIQAGGDVISGDYRGALARSISGTIGSHTVLINSSTSLEDLHRNDTFNQLTLGFSNDIAEYNDAGRRMLISGDIKDQDISAIARLGARTGLAVGAVVAAPAIAGSGTVQAAAGSIGAKAGAAIGTAATGFVGNEINKYINPPSEQVIEQSSTAKKSSAPLFIVGAGVLGLILIFLKGRR